MKEHITINKDRTVVVPDSVRKIGIQYDHKVNTLTFDCPRYADDKQSIDLSRMAIYINFSRNDKTKGSIAATNVFVDPDDPEIMHFDFVITRSVTLVNGTIICLVCAKSTDAEGMEDNHWNSELFNKLSVGEGMEAEEELTEEEIDYITSLLQEINTTHAEVADIDTRVEDLEFNQEKQGTVSEVDLEAMTWTEGSYITGSGTIGSSSGYGISELVTLPKMSTLILDATGYQSDVAMIAKSDHTPLVTSVDGKTHYEYYTGEEIQVYISCKTTAAKSAKIVRNVAETLSDLERENSELKSDLSNKLPKSPANWGPWTAKEQAVAREKIVADGGEMELIAEVTTTEELDEISVSNFTDGTQLKLKSFMLYFVIPKASSDSFINSGYKMNYGNNITINRDSVNSLIKSGFDTYNNMYVLWNNARPIGLVAAYATWANGSSEIESVIKYDNNLDDNANYISEVHLSKYVHGIKIPSGTMLKLYGVRV